jgi:hypothetical protein
MRIEKEVSESNNCQQPLNATVIYRLNIIDHQSPSNEWNERTGHWLILFCAFESFKMTSNSTDPPTAG